jgi:hypothetical protein
VFALFGLGRDLIALLARENLGFAFRVRERLLALRVRESLSSPCWGEVVIALRVREKLGCSPG